MRGKKYLQIFVERGKITRLIPYLLSKIDAIVFTSPFHDEANQNLNKNQRTLPYYRAKWLCRVIEHLVRSILGFKEVSWRPAALKSVKKDRESCLLAAELLRVINNRFTVFTWSTFPNTLDLIKHFNSDLLYSIR